MIICWCSAHADQKARSALQSSQLEEAAARAKANIAIPDRYLSIDHCNVTMLQQAGPCTGAGVHFLSIYIDISREYLYMSYVHNVIFATN